MDASFFDRVIRRHGTLSEKWDNYDASLLPMWVADMDFASPPEVTQALQERAAHPTYGYTRTTLAQHTQPLLDWWKTRHQLDLTPEMVHYLPGVVSGLMVGLRCLTQPGDSIVIQTPVYGPFFRIIRQNHRNLMENPLILDDADWHMDLDHLEQCFKNGAKLLIFCSPHNPIGRVWTREELSALMALCVRYDVRILSDEIHADFVYPGHCHTPLFALPGAAERTVLLAAPSKTFNIAGLHLAAMFVQDEALRKILWQECDASGVEAGNLFAFAALGAAYTHGAPWLEGLLAYLDTSRTLIAEFLAQEMPQIGFHQVEGTYLTLLDFRSYGLDEAALRARLERSGGVALSPGSSFGAPGFMRLNFGCPHALLTEGLERIKRYVQAEC